MRKVRVLISGRPGVGKSTVAKRVFDILSSKGLRTGGIMSPEIREKGVRLGFKIIDLLDQKEGTLAHINERNGPPVGKYRVNLGDLEAVGVTAIEKAIKKADWLLIDEIGKMELFSKAFQNVVIRAFDSEKPILAVIPQRYYHPTLEAIRRKPNVRIYEVTLENREYLPEKISSDILLVLKGG
ncbi:MAG: NTPase [Promethearchaeota archaeon]